MRTEFFSQGMFQQYIQYLKNIIRPAIVTALILLIPLALQLTIGTGVDGRGFNWKPGDFLVAGVLLFGTGLVLEFIAKKFFNPVHRVAAVFAIIAVFLLIWAELAVGIFGTPFAGS